MKMLKYRILSLFLILAAPCLSYAFDNHDFQVWHTEEQEKKLGDKFKITLQEEARLGDNGGNFYYQHYEPGFLWLVNKNFDLGIYYRQILEKKDGEFLQQNYPHINGTLKAQLFDFELQDRNWFGYRFIEKGTDQWQYRNKLTIKLPWKFTRAQIQPFLADEIFIYLDKGTLDRNRFYSGFDFNLTKDTKASVYYLWQTTKSSGKWKDYNVFGTKIKLSF